MHTALECLKRTLIDDNEEDIDGEEIPTDDVQVEEHVYVQAPTNGRTQAHSDENREDGDFIDRVL